MVSHCINIPPYSVGSPRIYSEQGSKLRVYLGYEEKPSEVNEGTRQGREDSQRWLCYQVDYLHGPLGHDLADVSGKQYRDAPEG